jgi:transcriptional regulator with XRE-family HTH domain
MESNDPRFRHVGVSSDGAVIFCTLDNGKTYAMPLGALERAEDWDPSAKPRTAGIMHDGYAAFIKFNSGVTIEFPSDLVLHVCEPSYAFYKTKDPAASSVGMRIREIREARGLTLDALAAKSGIAKPNLSRLENDKVTPTFETLSTIAAALDTHPVLLVTAKKPEHAWTWTQHVFDQWRHGLLRKPSSLLKPVSSKEMVEVFLRTRPEHEYARQKLLKHDAEIPQWSLDAEKWAREKAAADAVQAGGKRRRELKEKTGVG